MGSSKHDRLLFALSLVVLEPPATDEPCSDKFLNRFLVVQNLETAWAINGFISLKVKP